MRIKKWNEFISSVLITICCVSIGYSDPFNKAVEINWRDQAKQEGLSDEDIAQLDRDKILITDIAYKQIFTAYDSNLPVFITSDSLLNAYHVLFEASFKQFEKEKAEQLPALLAHMMENVRHLEGVLQCDPEVMDKASRRSQLVVGIALKLIDDSFSFQDKELNEILDAEISKIIEAEKVEMSEWLGEPDFTFIALDYSRYKPRGFYTQNEELACYFRSISWLQSIPFRSDKDVEFASFLMISSSILVDDENKPYTFIKHQEDTPKDVPNPFGGPGGRDGSFSARPSLHDEFRDFFSSYESLMGLFHGPNLISVAYCLDDVHFDESNLSAIRTQVQEEIGLPDPKLMVNDLVRYTPVEQEHFNHIDYRIVSSYNSPSSILFSRTMDVLHSQRLFPQGLEIPAALGSEFACQSFSKTNQQEVLDVIVKSKPLFDRYGIYGEYYKLMKTLVDAPEHDAPTFVGTEAWQRKNCQTVLASWAQQKHTFALHDTKVAHFGCKMGGGPVGFVEPDPMFFSQMKKLAQTAKEEFNSNKEYRKPYRTPYDQVMGLRQSLKDKGVIDDGQKTMVLDVGKDEYLLLGSVPMMDIMRDLRLYPSDDDEKNIFNAAVPQYFIDDLKNRVLVEYRELNHGEELMDSDSLWSRLIDLSSELELICHKQLRGVDLSYDERRLLGEYWSHLAGVMMYYGNSYLQPKDDAPKIVDVYTEYIVDSHLNVGVSRARKIYVLYPWKGKECLSQGGVMPYYEFPSRTRLTDEEWKKSLDSESRPPIPEWVMPIVSGGELNAPVKLAEDR